MSGTDVLLVVLTVTCLFAVAGLAVALVQMRVLVRQLRNELERFHDTALPAAADLSSSAQLAAHQVDRLENLIDVASQVTDTMDTATAATVRVLSSPVIKTAAIARGTRKAARRLKSAD